MTVAVQTPLVNAVAAGGQTVFPFAFRCDDSATIVVYKNDILQAGGAYAVALNADQTAAPGGTVTFGVGLLANDIVSIERDSVEQQTAHFTAYSAFPAATVETALDRAVMIIQEIWAVFTRVFRVTRANLSKLSSLDWPTPELGKLVGWGDGGAGKFKLINYESILLLGAVGEKLTDSGNHLSFTSAHVTKGAGALYRNGGRIFPVDDYTQVIGTNVWTVTIALEAGEKLNADYPY
jgi:hypothetical protein